MSTFLFLLSFIVSVTVCAMWVCRRRCATCGHREWEHIDGMDTHCRHEDCLARADGCMEFRPDEGDTR